MKKYYQYYKYIPILQIFKYWKLEIGSIGNSRRRRGGLATFSSHERGFTFVEIIMYMGLLAFVLLILTQILSSILEVRLESEAASSVHQDGRFILARLTRDINRAKNIVLPATPSAQTDTLALTIDSILHTYSLLNNNIMITNNIGSNNLNSYETTTSNLSFKRLGNIGGKNTITVSFTLTSATERKKGPDVKTFQTTVGIR